jgi:hypothetical protein
MKPTVQVGKYLSDTFPIKNVRKHGDALAPLFFSFTLECATGKIQANQEGLKLNVNHHLPFYADDVNLLSDSIHTIKKNIEALLFASKETDLEVNAEKRLSTLYIYVL